METTSEETTTEELSFEKEETQDYVSQDEARKIEWDGADSPIGLFQNFQIVFFLPKRSSLDILKTCRQ